MKNIRQKQLFLKGEEYPNLAAPQVFPSVWEWDCAACHLISPEHIHSKAHLIDFKDTDFPESMLRIIHPFQAGTYL